MSIVSSKNFTKQLDVRIHNMWLDTLTAFPTFHNKVAKIDTPEPGNEIREAELSPLGVLRPLTEGQMVEYDIPVEGHEKARNYSEFGLGFQITEVMKEDLIHKQILQMPQMLGRSAAMKTELAFWDLFNSGFTTHLAIDGQYIFDTSGRTYMKTGEAVDNRPDTDVALTESSLQDAFEYFENLKDDAGLPYPMMGKKLLIVPSALRWQAQTLYNAAGKPGSMDNDPNTVKNGQYKDFGAWDYMVVPQFLSSTTAWFVLDVSESDFRLVWKRQPKLMSFDDPHTGNTLYKTTSRFATFCNKWRGCYGTTGA